MGWKSTLYISRADALEFLLKSLRNFNDATVRDYLERLVEFRCSDTILGDIMDELVDKLHDHDFDTGSYYGHNFVVSNTNRQEDY